MHIRYLEWDPARHGDARPLFDKLFDLFQQLLQHTAGDVAEALSWLTQLDERYGLTGEEAGIGDFIEELKKRGYLQENEIGELQMTPRTERSLQIGRASCRERG